MKKRILNVFIAVTFSLVASFAGNTPSVSSIEGQSLIIDTKDWKSNSVSVEIRDNKGDLIFEDSFTAQTRKKLNLKRLPKGEYTLVMSSEMKETRQVFTLGENETIVLSEMTTTYKPVININDQYVDLNYMAPDNTTSISIYGYNDEIFTMSIEDQKSISKRFDIQRLPAGTYTFNVSSNHESYSKVFRK